MNNRDHSFTTVAASWIGKPNTRLIAIALLGCASVFGLIRQGAAQAGVLDPSFGTRGVFAGASATFQMVTSVALQSDGKILAAGLINNLPGVLRLNTNGTADTSFGSGGVATTSFNNNAQGDVAVGVAEQADGKIVIAITALPADNGSLGFLLARFNANGSPDTSFGEGGTVTTFPFNQFSYSPSVMTLQPDGMILVAGTGVIARYQTNGQLDPNFGTGGEAVLASQLVSAMTLQNGKILITSGGNPFLLNSPTTGSIARYNSNGSLDGTFGSLGQAAFLPSGTAVVVEGTTGKILVGGSVVRQLVLPPARNAVGFGVTRLNANGNIDATFGIHGTVVTAFASEPVAAANALVLQSNGDIVAAGVAGQTSFTNPVSEFALARYSAAGKLDPTFGSGGTVMSTSSSGLGSITAAVVQSDGKIVVVGSGASPFIVARYLGQ